MRTTGSIRFFLADNNYGFLDGNDGESYFVHGNELAKHGINVPPAPRTRFSFDVERTPKGLRAINPQVEI